MTAGALFTIGYEGRTQDEYLALLREAGVTLLADVRRNPISRKKGFSKSTLAQGCAAVGIRYEHLPELGIASEKRKNLATQADVDALFAEYERDWLPTQGPALAKLRAWLDAGLPPAVRSRGARRRDDAPVTGEQRAKRRHSTAFCRPIAGGA
jgi:hypothetical protein